jgi:hypothetical protein
MQNDCRNHQKIPVHKSQSIAENADANVGSLKKIRHGCFQITGQNSSEDLYWRFVQYQ